MTIPDNIATLRSVRVVNGWRREDSTVSQESLEEMERVARRRGDPFIRVKVGGDGVVVEDLNNAP